MDEAVDEGSACGFVNLVFAGVESAVCDVVADRAAEEPGVLQNHADVLAQVGAAHLRDVDVVESDSAGVDFVEAHEQVYQGGLAGTGGPDDGDHLPGRAVRYTFSINGLSGSYRNETFSNSM